MTNGRKRFEAAVRRGKLKVPEIGFHEAAIIVNGEVPPQLANAEFRDRLLRSAPSLTGWPPFVELGSGNSLSEPPYVLDDGWEALIDILPPKPPILAHSLDFWRIEPRGFFYHLRGLEDDLNESRGVTPGRQLNFSWQIERTAEMISTGLSFARSLGCAEATASLIFGFRWSKLRGRVLYSSGHGLLRAASVSHQDGYASPPVVVPLETPITSVVPYVERALQGLFAIFGGAQLPTQVVEEIVRGTMRRRH